MQITNSKKFDEVVSAIFARLLESFPEPLNLAFSDLGPIQEIPQPEPETIGGAGQLTEQEPSTDEKFFDHCVNWLYAEEYLTGTNKRFGSFGDVTLTQKAFTLLNATPRCLTSIYYR
ncbi:hypothetical protein ACIOZM_21415 [Pseudomonas sp. NPDC087346]|uniref:hypothetical protein n=1 Tax=Pseudomonas sp. NPDC087346 TaxID=3364438 RepID=UPI00381BE6B4